MHFLRFWGPKCLINNRFHKHLRQGGDKGHFLQKEMIFLLNNQNEIIQLNENLIMNGKSFEILLSCIRDHFMNYETLSISDFKKISNLTRKNAIPILEFFDSREYTKRQGSDRAVGEALFG